MQDTTITYFTHREEFTKATVALSLENFGYQPANPKHYQGPVTKSEHVLQYVVDGQGALVLQGKRYHLKKGDLFYLPKNCVLSYFADELNPYEYYWVGVDGPTAKQIINRMGISKEQPVKRVEAELVVPVFEAIRVALNKDSLVGLVEANAHLLELTAVLLSTEECNSLPLKRASVEHVNKAVSFIESSFSQDVNVTAIADAVGLKRTYFSAIFKRHTGVSPVEYLMNYRIDQAKAMLAGGMPVTEVALSCGFNSPANFSAQFKRITGHTPSLYRKCMLINK